MSANSAAHPAIVPPSSVRGQHYDALVVGSGHNGLVAALCAVCAGLRVPVVERASPQHRAVHALHHPQLAQWCSRSHQLGFFHAMGAVRDRGIVGLYSASAGTHPAGSVIGCAGYLAARGMPARFGLERAGAERVGGNALGPCQSQFGISTVSTTWITPFLAKMLAVVTFESLIFTPPVKLTVKFLPASWVGTGPAFRSPEPTAPAST